MALPTRLGSTSTFVGETPTRTTSGQTTSGDAHDHAIESPVSRTDMRRLLVPRAKRQMLFPRELVSFDSQVSLAIPPRI